MAVLKSLSEYFEIRISKAKNILSLELIYKEPDMGNGLECKYHKNIETEEYGTNSSTTMLYTGANENGKGIEEQQKKQMA